MHQIFLLNLDKCPILEQLRIEEALLRTTNANWCIINSQSTPAVVMGISGNAEELIDFDAHARQPLPIIRRFSGGGTVVIDEETLFATFLFQKTSVDIGNCPKRLLEWTAPVYSAIFGPHFQIQENDYTIGQRKIGGNAQYFAKNVWLHHTSFLWDFCPKKMSLLKMPKRVPMYRQGRHHELFLDRLCNYFPSKKILIEHFCAVLSAHFAIHHPDQEVIHTALATPHRKATVLYTQ